MTEKSGHLTADLAIIGGGIIGLATAYRFLQRSPDASVVVIEKEATLASHQTGNNSGVLHSGIYYKPGSLKANNCRAGKLAMQTFCKAEDIPFDLSGKVIVAVDETEEERLGKILERGKANNVECRLIDQKELHELEPHVRGVSAIAVPEAGIVNYRKVCERLAERIRHAGGVIQTGTRVRSISVTSREVTLQTSTVGVTAQQVVNCAGLFSDRVAKMTGMSVPAKIVPFRGEYFELKPEMWHLCRSLIYPVPDPNFPFLGVHFTRMIEGGVECGPNAVLAFAREGYRKRDINPRDLIESLSYPGFLRLAGQHWKAGMGEMWRSLSKSAFVSALQRLMPEIRKEHLVAAPAGVRAQALARDGSLIDDFLILQSERVVNVCNAPSPAATASLNIAKTIVDRLVGTESDPVAEDA